MVTPGTLKYAAVVTIATMAACTAPSPKPIEFLTRSGCVQTKIMRVRTDAAVKALALPNSYTVVDLDTLPPDDVRRGYPTPTVLVGGADLFGMAAPTQSNPQPT